MEDKALKNQLKPVFWKDVEEQVLLLNPHLHRLISALSPDNSYRIYRVRYPYGTVFVKNGLFQLPDGQGKMQSLMDERVSSQIREDLSYNKGTNPVSLLLNSQVELYIEEGMFDVPISFGLVSPGHLLSTSYILAPEQTYHPRFKWNISAGARSIFTLPKITNKRSFQRLKKTLHLQSEAPKQYVQQWPLFCEIANVCESNWYVDILFFSKKWFEQLDDEAWRDFHQYLLKSFQRAYQFWTYKFMWDMACAFIIKKRQLKPSLYVANTIKHLLFMATGSTCGMGPALNDAAAPITLLQKVLLEVYGLKEYLPTIFIPKRFHQYDQLAESVYYSFNYPNMMEMTLRPRQHDSLLMDLYETYAMLKKYLSELQSHELNLTGSPLYDIPNHVQFDAFHVDAEPYQLLRSSAELAIEDNNLSKLLVEHSPVGILNHNASFFKGCIRLSTMNTK